MRQPVRRAMTIGMSALLTALLVLPASGAMPGPTTAGGPPPDMATRVSAAPVSPTRITGMSAAQGDDSVGRWQVTPVGDGRHYLTWVSPVELPTTDARPEFVSDGALVGAPQLSADGRTLTLEVVADSPPAPADLDVVLSGDVLDSSSEPAAPEGYSTYVDPPATSEIAADPGTPGGHAIETEDYRLPGLAFPGMPARLEVLGHVVQPTDADSTSPLVLFLHGRHQACYGKPTGPARREWPCPEGMLPVPSHLGYDYIQRRLATQGYVTVSIAANGINAQDWRLVDGGAEARATLIRRHLAQWVTWSESATPRFVADLDNVVLVGHSRGGEGANRASLQIPLSAPYRISGQLLIGPTDFGRQTTAYVHTVTLLPHCDGDVSDLQGQIFTDAARDLVIRDTALHSSVMVMGANHNYFNSEWTPGSAAPSFDDWGGDPDRTCGTNTDARLTAQEQRRVGRTYVAGAVHLMASDEQDLLEMFDGSHVSVPSAGGADIRTHLVGAGRVLRRMGSQAAAGRSQAAETQMCIGRIAPSRAQTACGRGANAYQSPNWTPDFPRGLRAVRNFEMSWDSVDAWGRIRLRAPLDLSAATAMDLRTIVDPDRGNVRLDVRLRDAGGHTVTITPEVAGRLPAFPRGDFSLSKRWAQTLRVPLTATAPVNLNRIVAVDLVGRSADGRVWVLDLAAVRAVLPALTNKRLAIVSLGSARIDEGDGPDPTIATVPYRVRGHVPAGAEIVVIPLDWSSFEPMAPIRVPITGSSGVIEMPVEADTRDDVDVRRIVLSAFPWDGVMTRKYTGQLRIRDDDPTPEIELVTPHNRVSEREPAVWRLRLSEPVDYFVEVSAHFVEGSRDLPKLRVEDVRARWIARHLGDPPTRQPLHRVRGGLWEFVEAGRRVVEFSMPVRGDGADEGREVVTLRVDVRGGPHLRHSIVVTDR